MKRALLLLGLVTLTVAAARVGRFERTNSRCVQGRSDRGLSCEDSPFFEFAPASGAGLPSQQKLCTAAAAHLTGQFYCLDDNGQLASNPIQLRDAGTLTNQAITVCPGGPDCQSRTAWYAGSSSSGFVEASNQERGDAGSAFTACVDMVAMTSVTSDRILAGNGLNGPSNSQFVLYSNSSVFKATVSTADCATGSTGTITSFTPDAGNPLDGQHSLVCINYSEGGDNKYRLYIDGVLGTTSSAFATICGGKSGARHTLLGRWATTAVTGSATNPAVLGGFYTQKAMTQTEIQTLTTALLADNPTGAKGEVLTVARASSAGAPNGAGTVSNMVRANKARIGNGGILNEEARTNVVLWSGDLAHGAPWQNSGSPTAPTLTQYSVRSQDSTVSATRLACPAVTGGQYCRVFTDLVFGAAGTAHCSIWVNGNGASGAFPVISNSQYPVIKSCAYTNGAWTRCDTEVTVISSERIYFGSVGGTDTPAFDVFVGGAQCELGAFATSYMPTTSAAATRLLELDQFPSLSGLTSSGSTAITFVPEMGNAAIGFGGPIVVAGSGARLLYTNSTTRIWDGANEVALSVGSFSAGATRRFASSWSGTTLSIFNVTDNTSNTGTFDTTMTNGTQLDICSSNQLGTVNGNSVCKLICIDPSPTRCR